METQASTTQNPQAKPTQAGQYYLLEKIAQGGMAEIFKGLAYDVAGLKKTVCIKKILPHIAASQEFIDMLVDEAKIAVNLSHGSIAQVYDLGKAGGDYFIVMEYVEGQNLSRIHKKAQRLQKRIGIPIVCHIISEVASGLDYMHRKTDEEGTNLNIVHRDISPQNIVVSYSGTVKIIDFGIAKAALKVGNTELGILKGKFAYMSPEQARGDKIDHRSDLFSLGVILHELLTGQRLFKGANNKETLRNVKRAKADPPSKIVKEIPEELDKIVLKALDKNRRHRYSFASELHEELLRFLHTYYPDFKISQTAEFVRELFKEELALSRQLSQEEIKTPHLILEKTGDKEEVTSGAGGIDWREFMIVEEELQTTDHGPGTRDQLQEEESEREPEEKTSKKWFGALTFKSQTMVLSLMMALILLAGGIWVWRATDHGPQTRDKGPTTKKETTIEKKPANVAIVVVESNPPGAHIYMDDVDTGLSTPSTLETVSLDKKHSLGLAQENYKFYKTDFVLKAGETKNFFVDLRPDYASIKVLSTPEGAQVWMDGELAGITPFTKKELEPGRIVKIEVRQDGFKTYSQELKTEAGKEHILNANLEREKNEPQKRGD